MIVPAPVSVILLFTVPNASDAIKLAYVVLTYNIATTGMLTIYGITYNSMNSVLTRDQQGRATLSITRQIFCFVGQIILNGISLPLMAYFGNTQKAWIGMITVYGILNAICLFVNFWGCREIDPLAMGGEDGAKAIKQEKVSFIKEATSIVTNKYWWIVFLIWTFLTFEQTMNATAATYYSQYVLNNMGIVGALNTSENFIMMCGVLLTPLLLKKFTRRQLGLSGIILAILGQSFVFLFPSNITMLMIAGGFRGLGVAPLQALTFALLSDVVEHVQWRSHLRIEGLVFAASTFGQKIASGIGQALVSFLYASSGYDGMAATQTASALQMVKYIYYFTAPACCLIILVCFFFYRLDKEYPSIMEELGRREKLGQL
jgi:GPH family glycoside/pentoside/hexuronide:cation symporter